MGYVYRGAAYSNSDTATGDTARRFETSEKKLAYAVFRITTKAQLFGDSSAQNALWAADTSFTLEDVDLSTVYFKNGTAGQNGTVSVVGVLAV